MIIRNVIGALIVGAAINGAAIGQAAQPAAGGNVPRSDYIATMDIEFRKMDGDKNGQVTRAEVEAQERGAALGQARARAWPSAAPRSNVSTSVRVTWPFLSPSILRNSVSIVAI